MIQFNRTPHISDFQDPELSQLAITMMHAESAVYLSRHPKVIWSDTHRKWWEWAMVLKAAKQYGFLRKDYTALGIGAGHEPLIYALANELRMTVATDMYGRTAFVTEAGAEMLRDPGALAFFDYDARGLLVADVDACSLPFADGSFDLLFSTCSLEHFGRSNRILQAMREAYRVLRPGGMYALATEYLFHDASKRRRRDSRKAILGEAFTRAEIMDLIVDGPGFRLAEEIDFGVDYSEITNVFDAKTLTTETGNLSPHIWLRWDDSMFTSLFLVLFKPGKDSSV